MQAGTKDGSHRGLRTNQSPWEPAGTGEATVLSSHQGAHDEGTEASFLIISSPTILGCEVRPALTRLKGSLCSNQLVHKRKVGRVCDATFVVVPPIWRPQLCKNVSRQGFQSQKNRASGHLKNPRDEAYALKYMLYSRNGSSGPCSEPVNSYFIRNSNKLDFSGFTCRFRTSKQQR